MKKTIFFIILISLLACNADKSEKIRGKIKKHKEKVFELNKKIAELEKELEALGEDEEGKYKVLVVLDTIEYRPFKHYFEASGSVESVNEAFISPEINGQIKEIYVSEGDRVETGQLLVKLSTNITENTIEEVETSLQLATTVYEKQKKLWEQNIGSEIQYLEAKNNKEALESKLETLRAQLEMAYIRSPINGIVDNLFKKEGELSIPGMQLMQIVNLGELYVNIELAETYLPKVKKGDRVQLRFPSYPDYSMEVPIHRVGNVINPDNRTFTIQLKISNRNGQFKPNSIAVVQIKDFETDRAIVVPTIIMKKDINGTYLYIAEDTNEGLFANKVYVETGIAYNDEIMITSGLQPGNAVIAEGYNMVSDGTEIKIK